MSWLNVASTGVGFNTPSQQQQKPPVKIVSPKEPKVVVVEPHKDKSPPQDSPSKTPSKRVIPQALSVFSSNSMAHSR